MARRRHQRSSPEAKLVLWILVILVVWNLIPGIPFALFFLAILGALLGLLRLVIWAIDRLRGRL